MSLLERGSLVDICANSGHENDPEKTVWTTSKELRIATGMSQKPLPIGVVLLVAI